jgi:hypothetical protein
VRDAKDAFQQRPVLVLEEQDLVVFDVRQIGERSHAVESDLGGLIDVLKEGVSIRHTVSDHAPVNASVDPFQ